MQTPTNKSKRLSLFARLGRKSREVVEGGIARWFGTRHPGPVFMRLTTTFPWLFYWLTPNDRWSLGAHSRAWLGALDMSTGQAGAKPKRIFMFCAYRGQFTMDFPVAVMLASLGHSIVFGYLPKLQSPIKPPLADHPSAQLYLRRALSAVESISSGRIRCVDLTSTTTETFEPDPDFNRDALKSDIMMFVQRETIDLSDPLVAEASEYFDQQGKAAYSLACSYFAKFKDEIDLFVVANGTTFETARFCRAAQDVGIPVNSYEKFSFRNVRVLTHGGNFQSFDDLRTAWESRERLGYLEDPFYSKAAERAARLLQERKAASLATWAWALQKAPPQTPVESLAAAGLPDLRRFVLVCPNIPYDAGYAGLVTVFPSMRAWLVTTVEALLQNSDIDVVVRAHPGEGSYWAGKESSADALAQFIGHPRLHFLAHDANVNTYGLMEACSFGAVFSSTTGLEMAMLRKTVIVGSEVYYARKGFTIDTSNPLDYSSKLVELATLSSTSSLINHNAKDAQLFHFILHFVMQWPFPFDKPSGLRSHLLTRYISHSDLPKYLPFLEALATSSTEWRSQMSKYISASNAERFGL